MSVAVLLESGNFVSKFCKSLNITRHERLEIHHPLKSQLQWDRYIQTKVSAQFLS